jgi:hypothetical protein
MVSDLKLENDCLNFIEAFKGDLNGAHNRMNECILFQEYFTGE